MTDPSAAGRLTRAALDQALELLWNPPPRAPHVHVTVPGGRVCEECRQDVGALIDEQRLAILKQRADEGFLKNLPGF